MERVPGGNVMTARLNITQATMERAIRAAKKQGCGVVEVTGDAIRIIVSEDEPMQPSPQESGNNTCDEAFGVSD